MSQQLNYKKEDKAKIDVVLNNIEDNQAKNREKEKTDAKINLMNKMQSLDDLDLILSSWRDDNQKDKWIPSQSKLLMCEFFTEVDISENKIKLIYPLKLFKNLVKIQASNNEVIDRGVENLDSLNNLRTLNLKHNYLKRFPNISQLPALEELDLGINLINDLAFHLLFNDKQFMDHLRIPNQQNKEGKQDFHWDKSKAAGKNRDDLITNQPHALKRLFFNNNAIAWTPKDQTHVSSIIANLNFIESFFPKLQKIDFDQNKFYMLYGETHKEVLKYFTIKQFPDLSQFGEAYKIDKATRLEIATRQENQEILQKGGKAEESKQIILKDKEESLIEHWQNLLSKGYLSIEFEMEKRKEEEAEWKSKGYLVKVEKPKDGSLPKLKLKKNYEDTIHEIEGHLNSYFKRSKDPKYAEIEVQEKPFLKEIFGTDSDEESRKKIEHFITKFLLELVEKTKNKLTISKALDIFIILFEINDFDMNLEAVKNLISRKSLLLNEIIDKLTKKIDKIDKIDFNLKNQGLIQSIELLIINDYRFVEIFKNKIDILYSWIIDYEGLQQITEYLQEEPHLDDLKHRQIQKEPTKEHVFKLSLKIIKLVIENEYLFLNNDDPVPQQIYKFYELGNVRIEDLAEAKNKFNDHIWHLWKIHSDGGIEDYEIKQLILSVYTLFVRCKEMYFFKDYLSKTKQFVKKINEGYIEKKKEQIENDAKSEVKGKQAKIEAFSKSIELFSDLLEEDVEKTMDEKVIQGLVDIISKTIEPRDKNNYQNPITFKALLYFTRKYLSVGSTEQQVQPKVQKMIDKWSKFNWIQNALKKHMYTVLQKSAKAQHNEYKHEFPNTDSLDKTDSNLLFEFVQELLQFIQMIIRQAEVEPKLVKQDFKRQKLLNKDFAEVQRPIQDIIIGEIFIVVKQVLECQSQNVQKVALDIIDNVNLELFGFSELKILVDNMTAINNIDNDQSKVKLSILFCLISKLLMCPDIVDMLHKENPEELKKYLLTIAKQVQRMMKLNMNPAKITKEAFLRNKNKFNQCGWQLLSCMQKWLSDNENEDWMDALFSEKQHQTYTLANDHMDNEVEVTTPFELLPQSRSQDVFIKVFNQLKNPGSYLSFRVLKTFADNLSGNFWTQDVVLPVGIKDQLFFQDIMTHIEKQCKEYKERIRNVEMQKWTEKSLIDIDKKDKSRNAYNNTFCQDIDNILNTMQVKTPKKSGKEICLATNFKSDLLSTKSELKTRYEREVFGKMDGKTTSEENVDFKGALTLNFAKGEIQNQDVLEQFSINVDTSFNLTKLKTEIVESLKNRNDSNEDSTDSEMQFLTMSAFLRSVFAALSLSTKSKDLAIQLCKRDNMSKLIELCSTTNWYDQMPSKQLRVTSKCLNQVTSEILKKEEEEKLEFLQVVELLSKVNEYLLNLLQNNIQLTQKDLEDRDYGLGAEAIHLCFYVIQTIPQFIEMNIIKEEPKYKALKEASIHIDSIKFNHINKINNPEEQFCAQILQRLISLKVFTVIIALLKQDMNNKVKKLAKEKVEIFQLIDPETQDFRKLFTYDFKILEYAKIMMASFIQKVQSRRHLVIYEFTKAILDKEKPLRRAYFNEFIITFNKIKLFQAFQNRADYEFLTKNDQENNKTEQIISNLSAGNIRKILGMGSRLLMFPDGNKETPLFMAPVNSKDIKQQWGLRVMILTRFQVYIQDPVVPCMTCGSNIQCPYQPNQISGLSLAIPFNKVDLIITMPVQQVVILKQRNQDNLEFKKMFDEDMSKVDDTMQLYQIMIFKFINDYEFFIEQVQNIRNNLKLDGSKFFNFREDTLITAILESKAILSNTMYLIGYKEVKKKEPLQIVIDQLKDFFVKKVYKLGFFANFGLEERLIVYTENSIKIIGIDFDNYIEQKEEESESWMEQNKADEWMNKMPEDKERLQKQYKFKQELQEKAQEDFLEMQTLTNIPVDTISNVWFRGMELNCCIVKCKDSSYEFNFGDDLSRDIFKKYLFWTKRAGRITIRYEEYKEYETEN